MKFDQHWQKKEGKKEKKEVTKQWNSLVALLFKTYLKPT